MAIPLILNKDELDKANRNYEDLAIRMEALRNKLKISLEGVRDGWKSSGGTEFFNRFDHDWEKNYLDYIAVINHMATNMRDANKMYEVVFECVDDIKLR